MRLDRTLPLPTLSKIDQSIERAEDSKEREVLTDRAVEFSEERQGRKQKNPQQNLPENYKPLVRYGSKAELHKEEPSLTDVDLLA